MEIELQREKWLMFEFFNGLRLFKCFLTILFQLPQQENSFDCGFFLLHYVELFLEDAPMNFNPFKITEFSNYVGDLISRVLCILSFSLVLF